ncbi:Ras-GAP domain-containing protein, variant 2 [Balamuthia mandrillaris]
MDRVVVPVGDEEETRGTVLPFTRNIHKNLTTLDKKKRYTERLAIVKRLFHPLQKPWVYKDKAQERKSKEALLHCWQYLLKEAPLATYSDRPLFFKEIVFIVRRPEFDIFNLQWVEMKPACHPADLKLAVDYHNMLNETLHFSVNKLNRGAVYSSLLEFCSKMLAINYFCFPKLMVLVLDSVWPEGKEKAAASKDKQLYKEIHDIINAGLQQSLHNEEEDLDFPSRSTQVFGMMGSLFSAMEGTKPLLIQTQSKKQAWLRKFTDRGQNFYVFLSDFIDQVCYLTGDHRAVQWHVIPGYRQFVHAFLFELKTSKTNVSLWQQDRSLMKCSCSLLVNPSLLNLLVKILFTKTSVHDIPSAEAAVDMLMEWFETVRQLYNRLPPGFDYEFFFKGLCILLQQEHHVLLARVLMFLYYNLGVFFGGPRVYLLQQTLLRDMFFKFFCHWNTEIRDLYHRVLVFKAQRLKQEYNRLDKSGFSDCFPHEQQIDKEIDTMIENRIQLMKARVQWDQVKDQRRKDRDRQQELAQQLGLAGLQKPDPKKLKKKPKKTKKDKKEKEKEKAKAKEKDRANKKEREKQKWKSESSRTNGTTSPTLSPEKSKSTPKERFKRKASPLLYSKRKNSTKENSVDEGGNNNNTETKKTTTSDNDSDSNKKQHSSPQNGRDKTKTSETDELKEDGVNEEQNKRDEEVNEESRRTKLDENREEQTTKEIGGGEAEDVKVTQKEQKGPRKKDGEIQGNGCPDENDGRDDKESNNTTEQEDLVLNERVKDAGTAETEKEQSITDEPSEVEDEKKEMEQANSRQQGEKENENPDNNTKEKKENGDKEEQQQKEIQKPKYRRKEDHTKSLGRSNDPNKKNTKLRRSTSSVTDKHSPSWHNSRATTTSKHKKRRSLSSIPVFVSDNNSAQILESQQQPQERHSNRSRRSSSSSLSRERRERRSSSSSSGSRSSSSGSSSSDSDHTSPRAPRRRSSSLPSSPTSPSFSSSSSSSSSNGRSRSFDQIKDRKRERKQKDHHYKHQRRSRSGSGQVIEEEEKGEDSERQEEENAASAATATEEPVEQQEVEASGQPPSSASLYDGQVQSSDESSVLSHITELPDGLEVFPSLFLSLSLSLSFV